MKLIKILCPFLFLVLFVNCKNDQKIGEISAPASVSTFYFIDMLKKTEAIQGTLIRNSIKRVWEGQCIGQKF